MKMTYDSLTGRAASRRAAGLSAAFAVALAAAACSGSEGGTTPPSGTAPTSKNAAPAAAPVNASPATTTAAPPNSNTGLEVGTSRTIVKDLDLGGKTPVLADVVRDVERKSKPDSGSGRTFKVLSATGETLPDGKYRLTMRISLEAPGTAEIVYKPTGEQWWSGRIEQGAARPVSNGGLTVLLVDGDRMNHFVNIPEGKTSFMDGVLHDVKLPVSEYWKEGEQKEVHFIYSACGCPVEYKAKRVGNKIQKLTDDQVIFPDDPDVVARIDKMMGW